MSDSPTHCEHRSCAGPACKTYDAPPDSCCIIAAPPRNGRLAEFLKSPCWTGILKDTWEGVRLRTSKDHDAKRADVYWRTVETILAFRGKDDYPNAVYRPRLPPAEQPRPTLGALLGRFLQNRISQAKTAFRRAQRKANDLYEATEAEELDGIAYAQGLLESTPPDDSERAIHEFIEFMHIYCRVPLAGARIRPTTLVKLIDQLLWQAGLGLDPAFPERTGEDYAAKLRLLLLAYETHREHPQIPVDSPELDRLVRKRLERLARQDSPMGHWAQAVGDAVKRKERQTEGDNTDES